MKHHICGVVNVSMFPNCSLAGIQEIKQNKAIRLKSFFLESGTQMAIFCELIESILCNWTLQDLAQNVPGLQGTRSIRGRRSEHLLEGMAMV